MITFLAITVVFVFMLASIIGGLSLAQSRNRRRLVSRWMDKREANLQRTADVIPFRHRELSSRQRRAIRQRVTDINPTSHFGDVGA